MSNYSTLMHFKTFQPACTGPGGRSTRRLDRRLLRDWDLALHLLRRVVGQVERRNGLRASDPGEQRRPSRHKCGQLDRSGEPERPLEAGEAHQDSADEATEREEADY